MSVRDFNDIPTVSQPYKMKVKLFPHQLSSIHQMEKFENNNVIEKEDYIKITKIGINGDIMGYGKTLSMIGLICRDKMDWNMEMPYVFETTTSESKGRIKKYYSTKFDRLPTTFILVSNTILKQWVDEIKKTELTYKTITSRKDFDHFHAEDYDILLVIPSHYNRVIQMYEKFAWKRFIFDEPGHLKIASMKDIYAGFYWFVTATPTAIFDFHKQSKYNFIKDLFYPCFYEEERSFLEDIIIQNDPEYIKASFDMPITHHIFHYCVNPIYHVVNQYISNSVKLMIEAGNIDGAIIALGGTKTSNIAQLVKEKKLKEIYEIEQRLDVLRGNEGDNKERIIFYEEKQNKIENQVKELNEKFKEMLNGNCYICFEKMEKPVMEPNCQNMFCAECLLKWLQCKFSCPLCRANVELNDLVFIETSDTTNEFLDDMMDGSTTSLQTKSNIETKKLTKIEKVINLLKNKPDGKFLIYSTFNESFEPLCIAFREHTIEYVQIKGSMKMKEKNLELFKTGSVQVLFLNSTYDGAGINLVEATDIILYHQMSTTTEKQIVGRANRIGRKNNLFVHHLVNEHITTS